MSDLLWTKVEIEKGSFFGQKLNKLPCHFGQLDKLVDESGNPVDAYVLSSAPFSPGLLYLTEPLVLLKIPQSANDLSTAVICQDYYFPIESSDLDMAIFDIKKHIHENFTVASLIENVTPGGLQTLLHESTEKE